MIKDLVGDVAKEFDPQCAREDDAIDDAEDQDVCLIDFFKAPEMGTSYEL